MSAPTQLRGAPLSAAFSNSFSGPLYHPGQYRLNQISEVVMPLEALCQVRKTAEGVGCILGSDETFNGSALLISPSHILVPRHCFLESDGYILFQNGQKVLASTVIDGELDPDPSFKGDYKILLVEDEPQISPVRISISNASGHSAQINYKGDKEIYVKIYESQGSNYATRSDVALMRTFPGDSGGARCSLNFGNVLGAVHSMHQGESEGLRMNGIYHSLQNVGRYHSDDTVRSLANAVLESMEVIDLDYLSINSSTISLQSHHVKPEGPPKRIPQYVYRWTDKAGLKDAKKNGIIIDTSKPTPSIPTLTIGSRGAAKRSGAHDYYDRLLVINTSLIPNLTYTGPISSKGGHWQYNITCDIPKDAIVLKGPGK